MIAYAVQPLLHELRPDIVEGLYDRTVRIGGVIRRARGQPGAGQIAAHLREIGDATPQVRQLRPEFSQALSLTNVGAAASILNLGVSVVGFAIMASKLNRLQRDIDRVLGTLEHHHDETIGHLESIENGLIELRYLGLETRELLLVSLDELRAARSDWLDSYFAQVTAEIELLGQGKSLGAALDRARRTLREARHFVAMSLERGRINPRRLESAARPAYAVPTILLHCRRRGFG